jgi:CRP-like cAMP-binding protein
MISPEQLRRHPFFSGLSAQQLIHIADISEIVHFSKDTIIYSQNNPAEKLYLLESGLVDLIYKSEEPFNPKTAKEFSIGEINPGETFGMNSMIDPHTYYCTSKASRECQIICIDAVALRNIFEEDLSLNLIVLSAVARTLIERLGSVRIQLAAAWA